jgi:carboxyl-terminal processing protease
MNQAKTTRKLQVWLPLLFGVVMATGMFIGYKLRGNMPGRQFFYTNSRQPIDEVFDLLRYRYVDSVALDAIGDTAILAMLAKLDPHTTLIPAEDVERVKEDIAGSFFGIGIEFEILQDTIHVINVLKDGPAAKSGVLTGDRIIQAGDSSLKITPARVRKLLKGQQGSKVNIIVARDGGKKAITLTRDIIPVSSVDASYMLDSSIGYIRLNKFSQVTYKEFMKALDNLHNKGMNKLILDLRGNGGGVLDQATAIADEFLSGDKLITYTQGLHSPRKEYRCQKPGFFEKEPIVVLADEGTASASEILMGALQDWDRATIIGRRSFGKGLVQEQFELSNGSALRLTIARYYTPLGRSIQRSYANGEKAYYQEIGDRSLQSASDTMPTGKNSFVTPKGKKLYDGGGIAPDQYVSADTLYRDKAIRQFYSKNTISLFAYQYARQNKTLLAQYKNGSDFAQNFTLPEPAWQQFVQFAARDSIAAGSLPPVQKNHITSIIRSAISRHVWYNEGYVEVLNSTDPVVKKAADLLRQQ